MSDAAARQPLRRIARLLILLALLPAMLLALHHPAKADPADIDAAARGVVRVVIVGRDGDELFPISHGSGFAISGETVVTNAHVIAQARADDRLSIGIVPSDGGNAVFARLVAVSQRNDLALIQTTSPMRLPPLTIAGNPAIDSGAVTAVGFPMNVDRAQGLGATDIFRAQPPVKSTGYLSGRRPSREMDTLLHTAPIARGNSGGPLLDECGRVLGVNSFGTDSGGPDAEFFFAVSTRELLPFLRANGISPQINALPCRSLSELEQEERTREEQRQAQAQQVAAAEAQANANRREDTRRQISFEVQDARDNGMALAMVALIIALGAGGFAFVAHGQDNRRGQDNRQGQENRRGLAIGGGTALVALAVAAIAWLSRPGFAEIEDRLEDRLRTEMAADDHGAMVLRPASGNFTCTLDPARSRITGEVPDTIPLDWTSSGCVNERTQYGLSGGQWTRIFVPASEAAVSINRFDPERSEFLVERYLLDSEAMALARRARSEYAGPSCDAGESGAIELGSRQAGIVALLPDRPNERLIYDCQPIAD